VYEGDFETVEEHLRHMANRGGEDEDRHVDEDHADRTPLKENVVPDLCEGGLDSIANLRGEIFAFKGEVKKRIP
jgi:hypothetical protein